MIEMNKEQKSLFDALTTLQQEIALNSLSGMNDIDSYKNSNGKAKTVTAMEAAVSKLLSNVKVVAFIDAMKAIAVNDAVMSRKEMLERLSNMARVSMVDLVEFDTQTVDGGEDGPIVQSQWKIKDSAMQSKEAMATISEVSTGKEGLKIKQHSPLQAMKMISDMEGYSAPIKTEQSGVVATVELSKEEYAKARAKMLADDDC